MAKRVAAKVETDIPQLAPCFSCGRLGNFVYNPSLDDLPEGRTASMKCDKCHAQGPGGKTIKEAMELWNNLYLMSQTAKVYNTLAKVSSPAEFAIWMQGLLEQVKGLDEAKMTIAQQERNGKFFEALKDMAVKLEQVKLDTTTYAKEYTWTINQTPNISGKWRLVSPTSDGEFSGTFITPEILHTINKKKP